MTVVVRLWILHDLPEIPPIDTAGRLTPATKPYREQSPPTIFEFSPLSGGEVNNAFDHAFTGGCHRHVAVCSGVQPEL